MRNSSTHRTFAVFLGISLLVLPLISFAQSSPANSFNNSSPANSFNNSPPANSFSNSPNQLVNPLSVNSFPELVQKLLNAALVIGVPISVLFIVWAGFKFILARGRPEGLKTARANFFYTIIGVGIFVGASLIASIIVSTLQQLGVKSF